MAVQTNDITFSFDCGNGQNLAEDSANEFSFDCIKADYQPNGGFWYGVKIQNSAYHNQTVTFHIGDWDNGNLGESWFMQPVYRYNDGSDWVRISGATYNDTTKVLTFSITFENIGTEVVIHPNPPWTYGEFQTWIGNLSGDFIKRETVGQIDGKNLELLTITSPFGSARTKKNIWIFALQHPGEVWAGWACKGLVDFLAGNSFEAQMLREKYLWKIVPMANPDGVYQGRGYFNSEGYNLFTDWGNKNTTNVTMLDEAISAWGVKPALFLDLHGAIGQSEWNKLHINDEVEGNTKYRIRQTSLRLSEFLIKHTRMTATADINRSNNNNLPNYFYNTKGCEAGLVMEFCLVDLEHNTIKQAEDEGRGIAWAIHDYFSCQKAHFNKVV